MSGDDVALLWHAVDVVVQSVVKSRKKRIAFALGGVLGYFVLRLGQGRPAVEADRKRANQWSGGRHASDCLCVDCVNRTVVERLRSAKRGPERYWSDR